MDTINKILQLLEDGQHEEALKKYRQILHAGTDEQRFVLAEEMFHFGFLEEAKELIEKLLLQFPHEGELLILYAEICIELSDEETALLTLDKIAESDPDYPRSLLLQADLYLMEGLYEVCEQKLLHAKSILPNEIVIEFALGELYFEQGRFTDAIRSFNHVVAEQTEIAGVNIEQRLGDAYSAGGAFEEALPHYERALEKRLEINTLFNYALTALQAGFHQTAIERFSELKELDPEYHSLYLYLAKAYEKEADFENSFAAIQQGIMYDEYNKDLFLLGGKVALKLNSEETAEEMFRQALALDPEFIEAGLMLNKLLLRQEKYEGVLEIIELFQANEIVEPQLLWDEAVSNWKLEKYSEALNKYHRAYNFFKNDVAFLLDYGYFLLEEGKRREAAEIFNKLLKQDPSNEEYVALVQGLTDDLL